MGQPGSLLHGYPVHPSIPGSLFHVKYHRTVNLIRCNFLQHKLCFLPDLCLVHSLAVEVNAYLYPRRNGPGNIGLEKLILNQLSRFISSEANSDKCEFHTILGHHLPVDGSLVFGYVDTFMGNHLAILYVLVFSGFQHIETCLVQLTLFQAAVNGYKMVLAAAVYNQIIRIQRAQRLHYGISVIQFCPDSFQHIGSRLLPGPRHLRFHFRLRVHHGIGQHADHITISIYHIAILIQADLLHAVIRTSASSPAALRISGNRGRFLHFISNPHT